MKQKWFLFLSLLYLMFLNNVLYVTGEELNLPEIPPRPTLEELRKSLMNGSDKKAKPCENMYAAGARIKGLPLEQTERNINSNSVPFEELYKQNKKYDAFIERSANLSSTKLFSLLLDSTKILNLSLKSFDTLHGEIVVVDKARNKIIMRVMSLDDNKSMVSIAGYSSILGKNNLQNKIQALLNLIDRSSR